MHNGMDSGGAARAAVVALGALALAVVAPGTPALIVLRIKIRWRRSLLDWARSADES